MALKVIIITGASGSGKDTLASGLGLPVVKFASPFKRAFESFMCLPYGFLDTSRRNDRVIDPVTGVTLDLTYLDVMVNAFKVWEQIHPRGLTLAAVEKAWQGLPLFSITDLRKPIEVEFILSRFKQDEILHFRLLGRGNILESDVHLGATLKAFDNLYYIDNGQSEPYFAIQEANQILKEYLE
jgi:hypothetical protein